MGCFSNENTLPYINRQFKPYFRTLSEYKLRNHPSVSFTGQNVMDADLKALPVVLVGDFHTHHDVNYFIFQIC